MNKRVLVGISGGIDSAVAAALLKTQGYDVIGAHLQMWPESKATPKSSKTASDAKKDSKNTDDGEFVCTGGSCCQRDSIQAAREVCKALELPFHLLDARELFDNQVLDYVVHDYLQARLPNPCVQCNSRVKFELLLRKADELKCDFVATGHYAKIVRSADGSETNLYRAADEEADQSYFLFGLRQDQLARALLPVGDLLKANIRRMALTFELPAVDRPETREICFVGEGGYKSLIVKRSSDRYRHPGPIVTQEGSILGRHTGLYLYSIGQKEGLGLQNNPEHQGFKVIGFELKVNALIVGPEEAMTKKGLLATDCNWLGMTDFSRGLHVVAKIGPYSRDAMCRVTLLNNNSVIVDFEEAQNAIIPGQAIVFYQEGLVLGGGWIEALSEPISTKLRSKGASI